MNTVSETSETKSIADPSSEKPQVI